jgi:hypothetical protein
VAEEARRLWGRGHGTILLRSRRMGRWRGWTIL